MPPNSDYFVPNSKTNFGDNWGIQLNSGRIVPVGQVANFETLTNGATGFQIEDVSMNLGYLYTAPPNDRAHWEDNNQWVDNGNVNDYASATVNLNTMVVYAGMLAVNVHGFSSYRTTATITLDNWSGQQIWSGWIAENAPASWIGSGPPEVYNASFKLPSNIAWEQIGSIHVSVS